MTYDAKARLGNFTSSEIYALMTNGRVKDSFGAPAITYIKEKLMERRLGRPLDSEASARPLSWGNLVEKRAFDLLGLEYILVSTDTIIHPVVPFWAGSPDGLKKDTVIDIKCPLTLKSFCQLVDTPTIEGVRENHRDGEKFYWQLVSNACLTESEYAELVVYVPYKDELEEIREMARNADQFDQYKYLWIDSAMDNELPWLERGGFYKNLNVINFKVPIEDKEALKARVIRAEQELEILKTK